MSCYELRTYDAVPGRMPDLLTRFKAHTEDLFAEHGIESIGYWIDDADENRLVYLLRHSDAEKSWTGFKSDSRWLAAKAESEADGPLTTAIASRYLTSTDFSKLQ